MVMRSSLTQLSNTRIEAKLPRTADVIAVFARILPNIARPEQSGKSVKAGVVQSILLSSKWYFKIQRVWER